MINRALVFETLTSLFLICSGLWLFSQTITGPGLAITGCLLGGFSLAMRAPLLIARTRTLFAESSDSATGNPSSQGA